MEDTCDLKCPLWKKFGDRCPNYIASYWKSTEGKEQRVKDCAPKRIFFMLQLMENRLIALEQSNQQQRNANVKAFNKFVELARSANSKNKKVQPLGEGHRA